MAPRSAGRHIPRVRLPKATARADLHARRIVRVYESLAKSGSHLLARIVGGKAPKQWAHYPDDDAIDVKMRFQWYYHSHSPADRPGAIEHGHIHLFARTDARRTFIKGNVEAVFLKRLASEDSESKTRHLLAIGLSPVGVPVSLFTTNRWVTGDQLLSSESSLRLLQSISLDTGNEAIDQLIASLIHLYQSKLISLFRMRDRTLFARARRGPGALDDESVEVLSEIPIDLDRAVAAARRLALRS